MKTRPGTILIVDDEKNIRKGLRTVLQRDGHTVRDASTAEEALQLLNSNFYEAAIVDICMPGMTGTELLQQVNANWPHVSVILLTGNGTLDSAIAAVKAGAHDYLLKPASPASIRQALARALAQSRRDQEQIRLLDTIRTSLQRLDGELDSMENHSDTAGQPDHLTLGDLVINQQAHQILRAGEPIAVTPSEYKLMVALVSRAGEVIDYVTLVNLVLDYEAELWEAKELIKRHVFSLRQKIELDPSEPQIILNVRGVGYRMPRHF